MEVRPARPEEHAVLGELTASVYAGMGYLGDDYAAELRDVAGRAVHADVLVAADGPALLGGVTYVGAPGRYDEFPHAEEAGIRHLAVADQARRRGVGTALVEACIARAGAAGKARVSLFTTPSMTAAHRLYEQLGFRRAPERDFTPHPDVPLLAYVLDLES